MLSVRKMSIITALVAMITTSTGAAGASESVELTYGSVGVGEWGTITVEEACKDGGEPAHRITIQAHDTNPVPIALNAYAAFTEYEVLRAHYAPGESRSVVVPISENAVNDYWLFAGWDGDAGFQAGASSLPGDCGGSGDGIVSPSNNPKYKRNKAGVCKAVMVHVDDSATPVMYVELNDGTTAAAAGWVTGRAWHFEVNFDPILVPVDAYVDLKGAVPYDDHKPRLNVGRC